MGSYCRLNRSKRRFVHGLEILEQRAVPSVVLNEVYVNPPGVDDNREFIELRSTTGGEFSHPNIAVVEIEGDPTGTGVIASDVHLSGIITGTNGMALIGHNYTTLGSPWNAGVSAGTKISDMPSTLGNDNLTLLVVEGYTGVIGQDLDINDDGVLDVTPWTKVLDSVGWLDATVPGGKVYTSAVLTQATATPDAASRFSNRIDSQLAQAWYNGDMLLQGGTPDMTVTYDPAKGSSNLPTGAVITPGSSNLTGPNSPTVLGVQINDGAIQRSRVTKLTVEFNQIVNMPANPAGAFQLTRRSDNVAVGLVATIDNSQGRTIVSMSFTGAVVSAGSLQDGLYSLTIQSSLVANANGPLDGNGDTVGGDNYQLIGTPDNKLFRLFGDADGNATVNATDFGAFRAVFGLSGPSIFDVNNDGQSNAADFAQFRARFGLTLFP